MSDHTTGQVVPERVFDPETYKAVIGVRLRLEDQVSVLDALRPTIPVAGEPVEMRDIDNRWATITDAINGLRAVIGLLEEVA